MRIDGLIIETVEGMPPNDNRTRIFIPEWGIFHITILKPKKENTPIEEFTVIAKKVKQYQVDTPPKYKKKYGELFAKMLAQQTLDKWANAPWYSSLEKSIIANILFGGGVLPKQKRENIIIEIIERIEDDEELFYIVESRDYARAIGRIIKAIDDETKIKRIAEATKRIKHPENEDAFCIIEKAIMQAINLATQKLNKREIWDDLYQYKIEHSSATKRELILRFVTNIETKGGEYAI